MGRFVLPPRNCPECEPKDNGLMRHVRTESERVRTPSENSTKIQRTAFYRCVRCGLVNTEVVDPLDPRRV